MQTVKKAVILAGGLGTRFLPATKTVAKEMFPILDKPILQYLVEELTVAGIKEVIIVLGKGKTSIIKHFRRNAALEKRLKGKDDILAKLEEINNLCEVKFVKNVAAKGAGYALMKAKVLIKNEPFILLVGDEIGFYKKENSIEQMLSAFNKYNKNIIGVKAMPKEDMVNYGMIVGEKLESDIFDIKNMVEKPKLAQVTSNLSAVGKYIFKANVFNIMKTIKHEKNKELQYNDAIFYYIQNGDAIAKVIDYERYDTGSKLGFVKANLDYALKDEKLKEQLMPYLRKIIK
ncbi:MAG: UTP--glucose-1-phosphate uridylyltransferase [Clostridia bacterium]|nr:UTP--glucose-1-phosphate uridylyltransferase [Clostridia bacterium]